MSEKWSQLGAELFSETTVGPNTLAEFYLNGRGIRLTSWPAALRFHPAADHPKLKQRFPAMIAQVVGASEPSFQITYLTTDGRKAEIDKEDQRRTLGSNKGGAVFLSDDVHPGATLLVGEGVESVASAMQASGLPGVAVLGIGGLANVEFSPDVVEIVVLGENDDASRKAIDKAAPSLIENGVKVRVAQPPQGFGDFNDLIDPSKVGGRARRSRDRQDDHRGGAGMAAETQGVAEAKGENGKELASELSCRACGWAMRLFTDSHGEAYAAFSVTHGEAEAHRETHKIRSRGFSRWLSFVFTLSVAARRPPKACRAHSKQSKQKQISTAPGTRSSCAQQTWAIAFTLICATSIGRRSRLMGSAGG